MGSDGSGNAWRTVLRRLRVERGCSLSELSRRSGVGKGTISELENDRRGARLDTLFALTTALGAPLGALMPDGAVPAAAPTKGDSVSTVTLLARWPVERYLIEVYRATLAERRQESAAHAPGVLETVTVVRGRVLAGCACDERELAEGESLRYRGDLPHRFAALGAPADVVLLYALPRSGIHRRDDHR